jgi:hypothetical protein
MGHGLTTLRWAASLAGAVLLITTIAAAHPNDGYQPREPQSQYGSENYGFPAELSLGDLTFSSPYPAPNTLSDREKYYLFGTVSGPQGYPLGAYYLDVMNVVYRYYNVTGHVPASLSSEVIAAALGITQDTIDSTYLETLRSPMTGAYPALNAATFSPGQLYVRTLTADEIRHFSEFLPLLKSLYFNNEWWDNRNKSWHPGKLIGPVMYVRVYGEHEVIYEQIYYAYH